MRHKLLVIGSLFSLSAAFFYADSVSASDSLVGVESKIDQVLSFAPSQKYRSEIGPEIPSTTNLMQTLSTAFSSENTSPFSHVTESQMLAQLGISLEGSNIFYGGQLLDHNPNTIQVVGGSSGIFQIHRDGKIWQWLGEPCGNNGCPSWRVLN